MQRGNSVSAITTTAILLLALASVACDRDVEPTRLSAPASPEFSRGESAPSPLVTVNFGANSLEFWPFSGTDLAGAASDPVNVIFTGQTDPRSLRAALMFLDGDRTAFGFPDAFPFNCTWGDAIGGVQTAYAVSEGWTGNAIQLECGEYESVRFHLRFFDVGDWTLATPHFELLIPATTEHQVLSWELAEQLVVVDFLRSGALDPAAPLAVTDPINPAPSFRDIPAVIYNGLPVELRAAIGGPLGDVAAPVPIATDGRATTLNVALKVHGLPAVARQEFVIQFDQVIPKPFCSSGEFDFILVQGPVDFRQQVVLTRSGNFVSQFQARGHLNVTPVNPLTDPPTPIGETYRAKVVEHHKGIVTDEVTFASSFQMQIEIPSSGPFRGRLLATLHVGPGGSNRYSLDVRCLP